MRYRLLCFLLLLAACSGTGEPGSQEAERWSLEPDLVIGGASEGPTSFSDIRGLVVDSMSRIYVLEFDSKEVRIFDSTGAFVRRIGREGEGPGEFVYPDGLMLDTAGHIWVDDPRANRVTEFDATGEGITTHHRPSTSWGYILSGGLGPQGRYYSTILVRRDTAMTQKLVRYDFGTGEVDTLPWPECDFKATRNYWSFERGSMGIPFSPAMRQWFDPRGYVWCADTRYARMSRFPFGDTIPDRTYSAEATPAAVTPEERQAAIDHVREFMKRVGAGDADFGDIPSIKPILKAVDSDDAGGVWARVETTEGDQVFVFDSGGTVVAKADMPVKASQWLPMRFHDGHVYVIAFDSLDVPSVVRFIITR